MLTPEEKFNQQIWTVLKRIKERSLMTLKDQPLEYELTTVTGAVAVNKDEERKIIFKLEEFGVIKIEKHVPTDWKYQNREKFLLAIIESEFVDFYEKYKEACDMQSYLNSYQDSIMKRGKFQQNMKFSQVDINKRDPKYDIVFSVAGEQKHIAQEIKNYLTKNGLNCWIYTEKEAELVGTDQPTYLSDLFINKSQFCVILISADYVQKAWTGLERQYIISKWMKKNDFLIPLQYDDSKLAGLPDTIGYIPCKNRSNDEIAEVILEVVKHGKTEKTVSISASSRTYPLPKLTKAFNPYKEKDAWIQYLSNELKERISHVEDGDFYSDIYSGVNQIRILFKGNTIYSLNINKNSLGSEKGLSFFGSYGELSSTDINSSNAWGHFKWSKEKNEVVLELMNASLFAVIGEKKEYSKSEFTDDLWQMIVNYLEQNY